MLAAPPRPPPSAPPSPYREAGRAGGHARTRAAGARCTGGPPPPSESKGGARFCQDLVVASAVCEQVEPDLVLDCVVGNFARQRAEPKFFTTTWTVRSAPFLVNGRSPSFFRQPGPCGRHLPTSTGGAQFFLLEQPHRAEPDRCLAHLVANFACQRAEPEFF